MRFPFLMIQSLELAEVWRAASRTSAKSTYGQLGKVRQGSDEDDDEDENEKEMPYNNTSIVDEFNEIYVII